MKISFLRKIFTVISVLSIISQSLTPYAVLLPQTASAQEVVDQTTSTDTQTTTVDQTTTPQDTTTPTPYQDQTTPTKTVTPIPTEDPTLVSPTPTEDPTLVSPVPENNNSPPSENTNSTETQGIDTSITPTETPVTLTPTQEGLTTTQENTKEEQLNLIILDNVSAPSIDLEAVESEGSAVLTTDKPDYAPTDAALITGSNLLPNTTYTLRVLSDNEPATSTTVQVTSDENGVFAYAYQLDGAYRPNYSAELKDSTGNVVATITFTDSAFVCQNDVDGANDEPGQKDLTRMCADYTNVLSTIDVKWNWDETTWSGGNTGDGCSLYDNDGDGNVNFALCVTVGGSPAAFQSNALYSCGDTKVDRCTNPIAVLTPSVTTTCLAQNSTDDPFSAGANFPNDTQASCTVNVADVGGAASKLIDVCSYPSQEPNSDPSDCIVATNAQTGKLEIKKALSPINDSGLFNLSIDGSIIVSDVTNNGTTGVQTVLASAGQGTAHTFAESAGTNTSLVDYTSTVSCVLRGTQTAVGITGANPWNINVVKDQDIVCTITNTKLTGTITVNKTLVPANDPGKFNLQIDGQTAGTGANVGDTGTTGSVTVNTSGQHTVSETAGTDTFLSDYTTTYSCNNNLSGNGASIPAFSVTANQNVVCTFTNTRNTGSVLVNKLVDTNGDGTYDGGNTEANNLGFTWNLDSVGTNAMGSAVNGVNTGNHNVNESSVLGYHFVGWYLTSDTSKTCANTTNTTLPALVPVTNGQQTSITFCNARDTGTIQVVKDVVPADNSQWDFTVSGPTNNNTTLSTGGQSSVFTSATGQYTVSETGHLGTNANNYTSEYSCVNGQTPVTSGSGTSAQFTLTTGANVVCTFTNTIKPGSVTVTKYQDNNANGTQDQGEPNLQGWTVNLSSNGSQVTDVNGQVSFVSVLPNIYTLSENIQDGWFQSNISCTGDQGIDNDNSHSVTVNPNSNISCSIGNYQNGTIVVKKVVLNPQGGAVIDTSTLFHFTVNNTGTNPDLTDEETQNFAVTPGALNTVTETPDSDYEFKGCTTDSPNGLQVTNGVSLTVSSGETANVTCTNWQKQAKITVVKVVKDAAGNVVSDHHTFTSQLNGANDDNTLSDINNVIYNVNPGGPFTVSEVTDNNYDNLGCRFVTGAPATNLNLASNESVTVTCTNQQKPGTISGFKFQSNDLTPIANWGISLFTCNSNFLSCILAGTTSTDINGFYSFSNLLTGFYQVVEGLVSNFTPVGATSHDVTIDPGTNSENNNFSNFKNIDLTVCKVSDLDGDVLTAQDQSLVSGWNMTLNIDGQSSSTQPTNQDGCTVFSNLGPGHTYSVTEESRSGWTALTPLTHDFGTPQDGVNQSYTFVNFENGSISGTKFNDLNGNSTNDNESGLQGWTIQLLDTSNNILTSTTTNANGNYSFLNLGPGTYRVREVSQAGWVQITVNPSDIALSSGQEVTDVDFGNQGRGSITVHKLVDRNADGIFEDNDPSDFTWKLDGSGTNVMGTTVSNIPAGTHLVDENLASNYHFVGWFATGTDFSCTNLPDNQANTELPVHVNVGPGGTTNLTICNARDTGTITIDKVTDPSGDQTQFEIKLTAEDLVLHTSTLADEDASDTYNVNTSSSYTLTETLLAGWDLTNVVCISDNQEHTNIKPNGFSLFSDEHITCTFTNTKRGTVIVTKFLDENANGVWDNGEGVLGDWDMNLTNEDDYNETQTTETDGLDEGTTTFENLVPGGYTLSETIKDGWNLSNIYCDNDLRSLDNILLDNIVINNNNGINSHNVSVSAGETINCKVGNYQDANIIVIKDVVKANGDPLEDTSSDEFDFQISNISPVASFSLTDEESETTSVTPGTYDVTESLNADYDFGGCTAEYENQSVGQPITQGEEVTVNSNDTVTVTCVNEQKPSTITIEKNADPDDEQVFEFTTNSDTGTSLDESFNLSDDGENDNSTTFSNLNSGDYTINENAVEGWDLTNISCNTEGYDTEGNSLLINLQPGENVTCTFTNTKRGNIIVVKYNDEDGNGELVGENPVLSGWTIKLDELEEITGGNGTVEFNNLIPGTYTLGENSQPGWEQTNISCPEYETSNNEDDTIDVFLEPGQTIFCQILNHNLTPIITISKINDAIGNKSGGDVVTYTITLTLDEEGGPAENLKVTDLLPKGFVYNSGSWQALLNGSPIVIEEPTYASPGTWTLGNANPGDVFKLIYTATIDGSQQTGTYYDNAWGQGTAVGSSDVILASAVNPGQLDSTFVGTEVAVVNGNPAGVDYKATSTKEVLGASTYLPATGENTLWVIIATLLLGFGFGTTLVGFKLRKKYE